MDYKPISDFKDMLSFNLTCPFCNKKYKVEQVWNHEKTMNFCRYVFHDDCYKHLILWESYESGVKYPDEIGNLDWFTRVSGLPFRAWDVLQEIINNDELPQNREVRIRAFYVSDFIVFVFGNDAKALADAVLEKRKEVIRKFDAEFLLEEVDRERFREIWKESSA